MSHEALIRLAAILVLGVLCQTISWRLHIPSILLLLLTGIAAGPVSGFLQPDELFGDLLLPIVSLSVSVILFEGGLGLNLRELRDIGAVLLRLTSFGVAISWLINTLAAHFILEFRWGLAGLLGSILVVTGPTVIGPLLRQLRLGGQVGSLLRWEGIVIDPVGAILAVMCFAFVQAGEFGQGTLSALQTLGKATMIGGLAGTGSAALLIAGLRRFWIPDSLQSVVTLATLVATYTASSQFQEESGLLAATVMGIVLANQNRVSIEHIIEFKQSLTVLLISGLFVVLAARLDWDALLDPGWKGMLFICVLVFVARPATVLLSTWRSHFSWHERLFISFIAPRGIVAVAVSAVFSLEMTAAGYPRAVELESVAFLVVSVTVLVYGISAFPLGRALGLVQPNPQGVLFVGAHAFARTMAQALKEEGCPVLLVDSDVDSIRQARMQGLPTYRGSILAQRTLDEIDYGGLARLLAVSADAATNALACLRYREVFGRGELYQLPSESLGHGSENEASRHLAGRLLFGPSCTYAWLQERSGKVPTIRKTRLTESFSYSDLLATHQSRIVPLFLLKPGGSLLVFTSDRRRDPVAGDLIISLICPSSGTDPAS